MVCDLTYPLVEMSAHNDFLLPRIPGVFAGQGAALLFDSNKQPKPAYYAVADALAAATVQGVSSSFPHLIQYHVEFIDTLLLIQDYQDWFASS